MKERLLNGTWSGEDVTWVCEYCGSEDVVEYKGVHMNTGVSIAGEPFCRACDDYCDAVPRTENFVPRNQLEVLRTTTAVDGTVYFEQATFAWPTLPTVQIPVTNEERDEVLRLS